ncbi:hypothetical protein PENTCL1PPCAC_10453, partial [Pristionchus entomophagus]
QSESVQKALSKQEIPLKQKHARRLVLRTHHEKSCTLFWKQASRIQLDSSPVISWKFCHLLHRIIRDGHDSVLLESCRHLQRMRSVGDKHLQNTSYGAPISQYFKMLCARLEFHRQFTLIPGNLDVAENVMFSIQLDLNGSLEFSVYLLELMENLLLLQREVFDSLKTNIISGFIPRGQTLLAPLTLVILDISTLYDLLVQMLFHLHSVANPDILVNHVQRFVNIFHDTKKFYDDVRATHYFKYLVTVPTLPEV